MALRSGSDQAPIALGPKSERPLDGVEVRDHVEFVATVVDEGVGLGEGRSGGFANAHIVVFGEDFFVHLAEILGEVRAVGVRVGWIFELFCGEVGKAFGFGDEGDDVHAEAGDTLVEPEAHERKDLFAHLRVGPIEVGLFDGKVVEIPFVRFGVVGPG
jgi:hypothetical protein